jgi:hypothetical protein
VLLTWSNAHADLKKCSVANQRNEIGMCSVANQRNEIGMCSVANQRNEIGMCKKYQYQDIDKIFYVLPRDVIFTNPGKR